MSIKQEHPLIVKPETKINIKKIKNDEDSERTKTPDNKAEETKIVNTETEPVVEERPIFVCKNCNLTERYDCFNDHVSFNRKVGTKVDYYLARDPFSPRSKRQFLILGSVCSMCDKDVCIKPECSIFYSKFFCSICARKYISNFPTSIQEKIKTTKRI
ncbi:cysteine-rich DPF motif domain-containing protein 1 [Acyrthosiphon pisum]|uniref:Cysteine-rich DPF motif domain-containing protein 1 n=1 Tax=Acyrthosiphon pisum TaxID=7029 RepID=A0A8R2A7W0_ACYPI|nr:cysteine-rich DPF motif domain-containing protein 1 [Acyrthosiphon pisum]|eukprot:XP_003244737.1 PREDICTED: cysteine-rich DPF motif domain-containing protein 1 [Acyrthosiphon pisum]